ncbi:MAG: NAD(P)H-dependent oxidoreductase [Deltaproteobacteria bacterium]|nr:NAD(P)H-dependent oxidoreductase [Deltaproteobacteria bacterium]
MKKILAFSGSPSSNSINHKLVEAAVALLDGVDATVIRLSDFELPFYSADIEEDGYPTGVEKLKELFLSHDGFLISSPEYNGMMPAMLKNVIDWVSRVQKPIFNDKPIMLMSASPGERGGMTNHDNMKSLMNWWGGKVEGSYMLGKFHEHFDADAVTLTEQESSKLKAELEKFKASL